MQCFATIKCQIVRRCYTTTSGGGSACEPPRSLPPDPPVPIPTPEVTSAMSLPFGNAAPSAILNTH